jgi:hypothetical protein
MDIENLAKTVAKYAPLLSKVLPIPGGEIIGTIIASAFGLDPDDQDLHEKIAKDPDAALKLIQLQNQHKEMLEKIQLQYFQSQLRDKESARQREVEISKIPELQRDRVPSQIAKIFILSYFLLAFFLLTTIYFGHINVNEVTLIKEMLKEQSLAVMLILAYYYGDKNKHS